MYDTHPNEKEENQTNLPTHKESEKKNPLRITNSSIADKQNDITTFYSIYRTYQCVCVCFVEIVGIHCKR